MNKEWSLDVLYKGYDDPKFAADEAKLDSLIAEYSAFSKDLSGDPAEVLKVLPSVTYTGVSGDIHFDATGDAERDTAYVKKVNTETGAWDFVAAQSI